MDISFHFCYEQVSDSISSHEETRKKKREKSKGLNYVRKLWLEIDEGKFVNESSDLNFNECAISLIDTPNIRRLIKTFKIKYYFILVL